MRDAGCDSKGFVRGVATLHRVGTPETMDALRNRAQGSWRGKTKETGNLPRDNIRSGGPLVVSRLFRPLSDSISCIVGGSDWALLCRRAWYWR